MKNYKIPTLTIAGSDSSGGAGVQADLKTYSAIGTYGMSVITAITAQNTQGVKSQFALTPKSFMTKSFLLSMTYLQLS